MSKSGEKAALLERERFGKAQHDRRSIGGRGVPLSQTSKKSSFLLFYERIQKNSSPRRRLCFRTRSRPEMTKKSRERHRRRFSRRTEDVVIVGGGPTGIALHALLSSFDVKNVLLIERYSNDGPSKHPKAHFINRRTMEILRDRNAFGFGEKQLLSRVGERKCRMS